MHYPTRFLIALLGLASSLGAAEFAPVFSNDAVLQREQPIAIWGTGRDGESITVELLGKSATTTVKDGRWRVTLPAIPANASTVLRLRGDNVVELTNVALGEVWLGTGQSNMEWPLLQGSPFTDAALASGDNPSIRELKIPLRTYSGEPLPAFAWKSFDRNSGRHFGAVAYFFAAELQRKLGVVVGIVNCSYGSTAIDAWMSREALISAGESALLAEHDRKMAAITDNAAYEKAWNDAQVARKAWDARKKANPSATDLGARPAEPYGYHSKRPTGLRESMFALITPYTARGVLWYQGENNAGGTNYAKLLSGLMNDFRTDWARPDLPIFIAQLSSPTSLRPDNGEDFAVIREAQRAVALADPHSGLVVTLDCGERGNVHPKNKQPVGERFARLALVRVYGEKGYSAQSPTATTATFGNARVEIAFADLPGHLTIRDPSLPTLELQLDDGKWTPVAAKLSPDGKKLLVDAAFTTPPTAVRYAYRNFCALTLFSDEGLPVSPWSLTVK